MSDFLGVRCCSYTWGEMGTIAEASTESACSQPCWWAQQRHRCFLCGAYLLVMAGPFQGASFVEPVKMGLKSPGPSQSGYQARKSFLRIPRLCGSSTWFWDFSPETGRRQGTVSHQWFLSGLDAKDLTRALVRMTCCHQDRCRFLSCFMLAFFFFFFFFTIQLPC